jgi:hypothetical protein
MTTDPTEEGYSGLAHEMASAPGLAIFKQFSTLSLRVALHQQRELLRLEEELEGILISRAERMSGQVPVPDGYTIENEEAEEEDALAHISSKLKDYR